VASRYQQVYGLHAVRTLLERRPETIVLARVLREASGKLAELARALADRGVALERVSRADLDRLSSGGVHQGVLVEVEAAADSRGISRRSSSSAGERCGCTCSMAWRTHATSVPA
jgi:tRNA G18 (ribose-2'-O)-methylase SpoU